LKCQFLGAFTKLRRAILSFVMSACPFVRLVVCMEQLSNHWVDFYEILYLIIFQKSIKKIKFSLQYNKDNGNLHEDQCTLLIISCSVCLRMRNVSAKVVEKIELFSLKSCLLWDNVEKYCRAGQTTDNNVIQHMHIACCTPKAIDKHFECIIHISFPL